MQYTEMKRSVGIAVLLLITLVLSFVIFIVKEKGYLEPRYTYHFIVDDASSLQVNTPLNYSGFTISMIQDIELLQSGKAQMSFELTEKNRHWIRQNTVLTIKRPLIGSPYIEISPIDPNSPILEATEGVLNVKLSNDINDIIERLEPVVNKAVDILDNLDKIMAMLANEESELVQSIQNINTITRKFANNDALLTSITGDKNATKNVIDAMDNLGNILENVEKITYDFAQISGSLDSDIVQPSSNVLHDMEKIMK
ncbi:MAG: MCE family protein, partial [Campylobacterales bacterium]|nr:MCE family protein [Campylobacterales bacterium]